MGKKNYEYGRNGYVRSCHAEKITEAANAVTCSVFNRIAATGNDFLVQLLDR